MLVRVYKDVIPPHTLHNTAPYMRSAETERELLHSHQQNHDHANSRVRCVSNLLDYIRYYPLDYQHRLKMSSDDVDKFLKDVDVTTGDWITCDKARCDQRLVQHKLEEILDKFLTPHKGGICPRDATYNFEMIPDFNDS